MNRRELLKKCGLFSALATLPFFKFLSPKKPIGWMVEWTAVSSHTQGYHFCAATQVYVIGECQGWTPEEDCVNISPACPLSFVYTNGHSPNKYLSADQAAHLQVDSFRKRDVNARCYPIYGFTTI